MPLQQTALSTIRKPLESRSLFISENRDKAKRKKGYLIDSKVADEHDPHHMWPCSERHRF